MSCSLGFPPPFCLPRVRGGEGLPEQVSLWAYYYYSEWAPKEWNLQLSLNSNTRLNSEDKHWVYETRYKHMDHWSLSIFLSMLLLFLIMWLALIIYNRNLPQAANILTEDFSINKKKKKKTVLWTKQIGEKPEKTTENLTTPKKSTILLKLRVIYKIGFLLMPRLFQFNSLHINWRKVSSNTSSIGKIQNVAFESIFPKWARRNFRVSVVSAQTSSSKLTKNWISDIWIIRKYRCS